MTGEINGWSSKMAGKKIDDRRSDSIYGATSAKEVVDQLNEIFKTKGKITYNMPDGF